MVPEKPYFLNSPKRLLASYKLEWEDDDIQALLVHHPDLQGTAPPPPPGLDWFALANQAGAGEFISRDMVGPQHPGHLTTWSLHFLDCFMGGISTTVWKIVANTNLGALMGTSDTEVPPSLTPTEPLLQKCPCWNRVCSQVVGLVSAPHLKLVSLKVQPRNESLNV